MMKNFLLSFLLIFFGLSSVKSQMANGTVCPDFTGTDLNGEVHNLYSYLNDGISVVVTISATWCGPCWNYHNGGAKTNLYNTYGPPGSGDVQVLFIEGDPATNLNCLYGTSGCVGGSLGDWVTGKPFPIIHTEGPDIRNILTISGYPTVYMISAGNGKAYRDGVGGVPYQRLVDWTIGSFKMAADATVTDAICGGDGEIDLTVTDGYGAKTYQWSNGQTSRVATNLDPGLYFCTITDQNQYSIEVGPFQVAGITGAIVSIVVDDEEPSCFGFTDGYVTMNAALGNGGFTYLWDDGQTSPTKSNIGAGEHHVTITDIMGCEHETFAVLGEPLPLESTILAPIVPCTQSTGTITINAVGGTGSLMYDIGGAQQSSNVFTGVNPGPYTCTVMDGNNCTLSTDITLAEEPRPTTLASTSDVLTCVVTQGTVSGAGSSTGADYTYQWSTNNGTIVSGANSIDAVVSAAGSYVLATTFTPNGCTSTDTVVMQANVALPSITSTDGNIDCTNTQTQICATIEAGHTVSWNINGQTSNETCVTVSEAGNYVATATGTNGCTSTSTSVVTASADLPVINIASPSDINCNLDEVTISSTVSGGNINYSWTTTDGNIVSGADTPNPVVDQAGTYTLTASNPDNGCISMATVVVDEDTETPVVETAAASITCLQSEVQLNANVSGDGTYSYVWTTNDGNIVSGADSATPLVNEAGTYNVQVTNQDNGCVTTVSASVAEDINTPNSDFTSTVTDNTFTGQASTTDEGSTLLWDFGNGITSTEANPTVQLENGTYNVCLTVTNECGSQTKCQEIEVKGSSSDDYKFVSQIAIYPNPAKESINLDIQFVNKGQVNMTLKSVSGVDIMTKQYQGDIKDSWDVTSIPSGAYTITVTGVNFMISKPIIIVD